VVTVVVIVVGHSHCGGGHGGGRGHCGGYHGGGSWSLWWSSSWWAGHGGGSWSW